MYITQKLSIDQLYNIAINDAPGAEYDPLTQLRSRTFYGRPDFSSIYTRLRGAVEIGAFVGPREARQTVNIGVRTFERSCSHDPNTHLIFFWQNSDILLWGMHRFFFRDLTLRLFRSPGLYYRQLSPHLTPTERRALLTLLPSTRVEHESRKDICSLSFAWRNMLTVVVSSFSLVHLARSSRTLLSLAARQPQTSLSQR